MKTNTTHLSGQLRLVFPTAEHKQAALAFRQEHFDNNEFVLSGDGGLDKAENYEQWLAKIIDEAEGKAVDGLVPATLYFGMIDDYIVGMIQIRHMLNDYLFKFGGHIGYGVRPSKRKKGYATKMLSLALDKSRDMGIEKLLITCNKNNTASEKTIIKNGGVFENESIEIDGNIVNRYWIIF